ncbi:redoxin domain-containing protein [Sinisalibacter aestuarii]|uniref:Thioredoxin domain-containing protein n=1 Tax=Sinisalibacter aestuarii TaxID=2949426 RepID=A0ABQ5M0F8_9RHOB|nr:redoxin domain-containing protein [Sinisalibacter aestuarii]GKY90161.1 hypothetical protein STA1M1_40300 [Sinisalibacter aestuarii]
MVEALTPGRPAPALAFETVAHGAYDLASSAPAGGTLVVFHRGSHCKWTRRMLKELDDRIGDFALRGVRLVALSGEDRAATEALKSEMQLIRLPLGYGADVAEVAAAWGLYLTEASPEPGALPLHWEPAQVWVREDGTLGVVAVQSAACLWADATNVIRAIERAREAAPPPQSEKEAD